MKGSGFWFYTTHQQCEWKFYLSKVIRFEPDFIRPALLFGGAGHEALAKLWKTFDIDEAIETFVKALEEREPSYQDKGAYIDDLNRGRVLLLEYYKRNHEKDQKRYEVLAIEEEIDVPVEEFILTVKPDLVVFDKERRMVQIFEHKFTSYSIQKSFETVMYGDQGTCYLYAWNRTHPDKHAETIIPDILYNRKSVYDCQRPADVYRRKIDLEQFEIGKAGLIRRITQKIKALETGDYPPISLFDRRGDCDGDGFFTCEFRDICRTFIEPNKPPYGYHIKEKRT